MEERLLLLFTFINVTFFKNLISSLSIGSSLLTLLTSRRAGGSGITEATEATLGGSFATLVAFLARFLSAAANEDVLEAEAAALTITEFGIDGVGGGCTGAGGVAETGGRLIDEALAEATTVVPKAADVTLGKGCLVVVKAEKRCRDKPFAVGLFQT